MYESVLFTNRNNVQILQKKTHYIFDKLKYTRRLWIFQFGTRWGFFWLYMELSISLKILKAV